MYTKTDIENCSIDWDGPTTIVLEDLFEPKKITYNKPEPEQQNKKRKNNDNQTRKKTKKSPKAIKYSVACDIENCKYIARSTNTKHHAVCALLEHKYKVLHKNTCNDTSFGDNVKKHCNNNKQQNNKRWEVACLIDTCKTIISIKDPHCEKDQLVHLLQNAMIKHLKATQEHNPNEYKDLIKKVVEVHDEN